MAEEPGGGQEKTEEPTSRRLQEARKKGDVVKSMEVSAVAVLLAAILFLYSARTFLYEQLSLIIRYYLGNLHSLEITIDNMYALTSQCMWMMALVTLPLAIIVFITALAANIAQVGLIFSTESITPNLEKIDPIAGMKRLFSKQAMANLVKSVAKLLIVGYVAYTVVKKAIPDIVPLMDQEPIQILAFYANTSFWIFLKSILIIAIIAILDYFFQRWQYLERLKMTRQELREEAKMTEGDPMVKGRIRAIQQEMARRRMMAEVPKADVIITNPIHLAVAMQYDSTKMAAPAVLAKGAGVLAERIKEIGRQHNIPIVEDKPLAQALYRHVEIGQAIPYDLYNAVAEVLAYVYGLKGKAA